MLDFSECRLKPYQHQIEALQKLLDHPFFFNASEMGMGKTKVLIDAAQMLFQQNIIDRVVVVCPASVRSVWFDEELGELQKHLWLTVPNKITLYHSKLHQWDFGPHSAVQLRWIITNYDFIRGRDESEKDNEWLQRLKAHCSQKTLLVLDESSAIKNHKAKQTKACMTLRKACGRIVIMNGTPIANNPGDMFSQGRILDPKILDCKTWFHFRSRYGVMGGFMNKQIVKWVNLEDLQQRFAPYILRRLKTDCLDLPEKIPSVALTVPLSEKTWEIYKNMRDEMVAWLSESTVSVASQAIVKAMRLAQVTSGFLGGIQDSDLELEQEDLDEDRPDWLSGKSDPIPQKLPTSMVQEVGNEKLKLFLQWLKERIDEDKNFKVLVWCRFRPELARLMGILRNDYPHISIGEIRGGQKKGEREIALRLLDPRTSPESPVVVAGTPASGSMGLNLTAAHVVIYMSNDYSLKTRLQSEDRVHRPGQIHPVSYYDIVATGPKGQKTIDHTIIKALREKNNIAEWTTRAWISALQD